MDNRDAGESGPESEAYSSIDLAADAVALLDALEVPHAHVMGHSMGSGVAARLAVDHPTRVDHLILASAGFFERSVADRQVRIVPREDWIEEPVARRRSRAVTSVAPGYFDGRADELEAVAQQERGNRLTYDGWLRQTQQIPTQPDRAELASITAPTLVVHGDLDRIPVERAKAMAQVIPGAKLLIFTGVGHSPHIEQRERFRAICNVVKPMRDCGT